MIIFYEKATGKIVGTVDGRIHGEGHLNMWVGDKKEIDRIICNWIPNSKNEFEPEKQKDIFLELDKSSSLVYNYKINLRTRQLEKT